MQMSHCGMSSRQVAIAGPNLENWNLQADRSRWCGVAAAAWKLMWLWRVVARHEPGVRTGEEWRFQWIE